MNATITADFWNRYQGLIATEVLPYQWEVMNDEADIAMAHEPGGNEADTTHSGAIANLKIAAGQATGHHQGYPFQDTDVYKWLEAAAYTLAHHPDPELRARTDELIDLIAAAQDEDGYLVTEFQIEAPERRFARLKQSHELYTMGHYIEAGVAYHQVTGNPTALMIAQRMADCIGTHLGEGPGQIPGVDGHPEIELALARLYQATGERRYLDLAHQQLLLRGRDPQFFDDQIAKDGIDRDLIDGMRRFPLTYYQAAEPVTEQTTADGHAVRLAYLCTGMAHVGRLTGDTELLTAARRLWDDVVNRRMYLTGAIGSTATGESFTDDYDLPNDTIYGETCAAVGLVFFAQQMLAVDARAEYADVIERALYNGAIAGMSLDGTHFFYVNPLEADPRASATDPGKSHILTRRADWFGCACCPSNIARLVASVDQYLYAQHGDTILASQYIASTATIDGVQIEQTGNLPWDGDIRIEIANPGARPLRFGVRIPSWSARHYTLTVNGQPVTTPAEEGYVYIDASGPVTSIALDLDMSVQLIRANTAVRADIGKVAVQRGPLVYCLEQADNPGPLWTYRLASDAQTSYRFDPDLLGGLGVIQARGERRNTDPSGPGAPLYLPAGTPVPTEEVMVQLIPYFAWANRDEGTMQVWTASDL